MANRIPPLLISEISDLRAEVENLNTRVGAEIGNLCTQIGSMLTQLQQLNEPPKEVLLNNAEARSLLGTQGKPIGEKALCERMNKGIYIEGIHYTGTHVNRRWKKSRLEFWLENQHDKAAINAQIVKWDREQRAELARSKS
jgi:hypothetical protein